jgi:hypothetical protein
MRMSIAAQAIVRPVRGKRPFDCQAPMRAAIRRVATGERNIQKILEATKNKGESLYAAARRLNVLDLSGDVGDRPNHSSAGLDGVRPYLGSDRRHQGEKLPAVRAARRARTDRGRLCDLHAPEGPLPGLPRKYLAHGEPLPVLLDASSLRPTSHHCIRMKTPRRTCV